jgi:hypothetical protein
MAVTALLGFATIFLILGHSTLLYFKSVDGEELPLREMIFPWPKSGKLVSVLCLIISGIFMMVFWGKVKSIEDFYSEGAIRILIALVGVPTIMYMGFLKARLLRRNGHLVFSSKAVRKMEWSLPILAVAGISLYLFFFN